MLPTPKLQQLLSFWWFCFFNTVHRKSVPNESHKYTNFLYVLEAPKFFFRGLLSFFRQSWKTLLSKLPFLFRFHPIFSTAAPVPTPIHCAWWSQRGRMQYSPCFVLPNFPSIRTQRPMQLRLSSVCSISKTTSEPKDPVSIASVDTAMCLPIWIMP